MPGSFTPLRGKHGRSKSGVPAEEATLLVGWVARESNVVDRLLNKRYAALYPSTFVTYRRETDDSPSKVWPISADTTVSEVQAATYNLRHKHTSTLMAVARGKYDQVEMHGFSITWQSYQAGGDVLKLAFDTRSDSSLSDASVTSSMLEAAPPTQSMEPRRRVTYETSRGEEEQEGAAAAPDGGGGRGDGAARRSRAWASVLHVNGVAVYVEEQDAEGEGGAIMVRGEKVMAAVVVVVVAVAVVVVSAVVRAPPSDVLRNLVQQRKAEGLGVLMGARVVERIDANTQIIAQQWKPTGAAGGLCAPREVVLLRTWRQDREDETYVILYQSVEHRAVPRARGGGWYKPVRVEAAGFTVSPLMSKYVRRGGSEESQESLVTLGGMLGRLTAPLSSLAMRSVLEPVVTSVVILRDKVEQDRFVVRPLSMTAGEEAAAEAEERSVKAQASHRRMLQRTTTMLAYRKEPLVVSQQLAAQAVAAGAPATPPAGPLPALAEEEVEGATEAAAAEREAADAWAVGGTCLSQYWSCPGDCGFKVRGPAYLADKKKVAATPPMFELVATDLLQLEDHLHSPAPFIFCVQLMVPCVPPISLVASWASPTPVVGRAPAELIAEYEQKQGPASDSVRAFFHALTDFLEGDGKEADARRNKKFKLIPNIAKGSWIIRQSVGTTPVILGQKLTTKYSRGPNYFEVDVDISSSSVAASVTNLVAGATKSLTIDMGVLIEGQSGETLPEQLLGTMRLDKLDLKSAAYLDEGTGRVMRASDM
ncbi:hypothetical protein CHLNCDRAFT_137358 [Chlorella variabilis]|uniref:START domain-containing protein n=1 Tax=Chlorella variabilis TaxID=554065 RepID=E1ZM92_CHLVA|nr:hypothetical protein CHLNCDRAFT_137358 [Chlorella variabilis]EFN53068.1 hypothetical protein CHLNCDRAFT_137358 [Chlorella variabilis]|eukprot:XP_005845170.1 hypothetical protein CHLNCDRAFT_137358 [Chlorella variabilis]